MNISYTISALRQAGLTQAQIGADIGLSQTSVSEMETGKSGVKRPSYSVVSALGKLARRHGVKTEPS